MWNFLSSDSNNIPIEERIDYSIVDNLSQEYSVLNEVSQEVVENKQEPYSVDIPQELFEDEFYQSYLDWFHLMKQNEEYFQSGSKKEEQLFFYLWSDYLFDTDYTTWEYNKFYSCLKWDVSPESLQHTFSKKICEWKAVEKDEDYQVLRKQFIEYKKIFLWEESEISDFTGYIVLRGREETYTESDFTRDYFYFLVADVQDNCNSLENTILRKICEQEEL